VTARIVSLRHTKWSEAFGCPGRDRAEGKIGNDTTHALAEMLMFAEKAAQAQHWSWIALAANCRRIAQDELPKLPHNVVHLEGLRLFREARKRLEAAAEVTS
jgi:hypothetical protein